MRDNTFKIISKPVIRAMIFLVIALISCLYLASIISKTSVEILEKQKTLVLYQNSQEQAAVLREGFQQVASYVDVVNNIFPASEDVLPFINAMEDLASKNGMQHVFKFETAALQPVEELNLNKIPFNVSLSGTQSQFLGYLSGLEKMPYFTQVESLNITSPQSLEGVSQMNIRGLLYVR